MALSWPRPSALLVAATLLGLASVLFFDLLFRGRVLYDRDVHLYLYPRAETIVRVLALGAWPVWNPYVGFGEPLLSNPASQVLYPPTWLNFLLLPWTSYTLYVAGHFVFTAAGVYLLGRTWALSRSAALLAAALWGLSGPYLSLVNNPHHLAGASWMPWVLLASERALRTLDLRQAAVWGAAAAGQLLAGSADMSLLTSALVVANVLAHAGWRDPLGRPNRLRAGICVAAAACALALSCLQWLPALEVAQRSSRSVLPERMRTFWSVHPAVLPALLLPVRLDHLPLRPEDRARFFESREPFLYSLYLGLPAAGLVLASLLGRPRPRRAFLALAGLGFLLLALGRHFLLFGLLSHLPLASLLRYPVKATLGVAFCFALLAGLGLETMLSSRPGRLSRRAQVGLALTALLFVAGGALWLVRPVGAAALLARLFPADPFSRQSLLGIGQDVRTTLVVSAACLLVWVGLRRQRLLPSGIVAAAAVADLLCFHLSLNPTAPVEAMARRPPVLGALQVQPFERLYVYDYSILSKSQEHLGHPRYLLAPGLAGEPWLPSLALRLALYPTVLPTWGIETSYDLDQQGLYPTELAVLTRVLRQVEGTPLHTRLLRMGSVTRVLALHADGFEDLRPAGTFPTLLLEPLREFRVPDPLPRTYVVDGSRIAGGDEAFRALGETDLDIRREVILETGSPRPGTAGVGQSRIVAWKPDRVILEAELTAPGVVVLVDAYDPGWRATVDGVPSPVLKANLAFRAVRAGPGRHRIEYLYRPTAVVIGAAVSLLGLLAVGWLAVRPRRRASAPRRA